jgi:hypothetical protein
MATLDDKLMGEKMHNYCSSSSEDDERDDERDIDRRKTGAKKSHNMHFVPEAELKAQQRASYDSHSTNTGPKGVIKDWQRFKQLEREKNEDAARERNTLAKKLALTCKSDDLDKELGKESEKAASSKQQQQQQEEDDMLEDEFFKQYVQQKFEEMQKKNQALPRFGLVRELKSDTFLSEIDKEHKDVTVLVHIYDQKMSECRLMNKCLDIIAKDYAIVKICKVLSTEINLSDKFRKTGCPALLIYKNGELIGNFVKMIEEFGDEFCASDVENFLLEQNYLPTLSFTSSIRAGGIYNKDNDSDDELE